MPEDAALKAARPSRIAGIAGGIFVGVGGRQLVSGIEVVIDFRIDLLSRKVSAGSENALGPIVLIALPVKARGIQAVADDVVVRRRHGAHQLRDVSGGIDRFAKWIPIGAG